MWQTFMKEFEDMWSTKVVMKPGEIAVTRDVQPTSHLPRSQTSSVGGGSMRRLLVLKRSAEKPKSISSLLRLTLLSKSQCRLLLGQLSQLKEHRLHPSATLKKKTHVDLIKSSHVK